MSRSLRLLILDITITKAVAAAKEAGLGVNAGHDLNLSNLPDFVIPELEEVSIGHAFTVDCLLMGIDKAVAQYQTALGKTI